LLDVRLQPVDDRPPAPTVEVGPHEQIQRRRVAARDGSTQHLRSFERAAFGEQRGTHHREILGRPIHHTPSIEWRDAATGHRRYGAITLRYAERRMCSGTNR